MQVTKDLYLCPPTDLDLVYSINPFMDFNNFFDREKAQQQWENLVSIYKQICPDNVFVVPSKEKLIELCFFGDSVFALKNKCVFSRFATVERFNETEYVMEYVKKNLKVEGVRIPEGIYFEGSGETMYWNGKIMVGHGIRNQKNVAKFLEQYFKVEVVSLELISSTFYHLDTVFFPINENLIAYYEDGFT
jgi:N-dimethylarginine dimethylaminohydrolase